MRSQKQPPLPARSRAGQPEPVRHLRSDDPLIGTAEVAAEVMCHPVNVFRKLRDDPDFPRPIRISANRLAWRLSAIRAYVESRPVREPTSPPRQREHQ